MDNLQTTVQQAIDTEKSADTQRFTLQPEVAPFSVQRVGTRYRARADDIASFIVGWSHEAYSHVDMTYPLTWLLRLRVPCMQDSVTRYLADGTSNEWIIEWDPGNRTYEPLAYEVTGWRA